MNTTDPEGFSKKIRIAVEAFGCRSLGELVERLQAANPRSTVTLDQMYKWAQGRALPRGFAAYDDLALALGLAGEGSFVRTASAEAFEQRLRGGGQRSAPAVASGPPPSPGAMLRGLRSGWHAVYSPAWARAYTGRILRGCLKVGPPAADGARRVEMVERYADSGAAFAGDLKSSRRSHSVVFDIAPEDVFLCLILAVPGEPTPAIGGIISGQSLSASMPRPTSSRLVTVAALDPALDPEAGNAYLDPGPAAVARDLEALGYGSADCEAVARRIIDYLAAPSDGTLESSQRAIEEIALPLTLAETPWSAPAAAAMT